MYMGIGRNVFGGGRAVIGWGGMGNKWLWGWANLGRPYFVVVFDVCCDVAVSACLSVDGGHDEVCLVLAVCP